MNDALNQLYTLKLQKCAEQKALCKRMNEILCKPGGLNENTKLAMKNIQAAIAVSKNPGYFEYHETPDDLHRVEEKKILNSLARSVQKVHKELEQINEDIAQTTVASKPKVPEPPNVTSLSQWFDIYGKPTIPEDKKDQLTSFHKNERTYGGTQHYKAFKSVSTVMVKGRVTR
jgi:hypothetical protein